MDTVTRDKLPPDDSSTDLRSRQSAERRIFETRSSLTRQSTPMPTGEPIGQAKLTRRLRRKMTVTPIEAYAQRGNHVSSATEKTGPVQKVKNMTGQADKPKSTEITQSTTNEGRALHSNGVTNTPLGTREQCVDEDSPSLWMRKTPEEIVDFYRQLGPDWRNEFPKTDPAYSPGSPWYNKEVVPGSGIPVITNMSREPVGSYAHNLKGRTRRSFDVHSYTSETTRMSDYHQSHQDRRVSLSYGLNHFSSTPTSRLGYPSHAYPTFSSNYSSSTSTSHISRTRGVISSAVSMVTRLFTLVTTLLSLAWHWRGNHDNQTSEINEGVDTVDNGYYNTRQRTAAVQNYVYKTGAKRSSLHHRTSVSQSYLYLWTHTLLTQLFRCTSWLIENNSWLFWIKDQNTQSPRGRTRSYVRIAALALVLLLFGFWLLSPLNGSHAVNSTTETTYPLPSDTDTSQPISFTGHLIYDTVTSCVTTAKNYLYATGKFIATPFSADTIPLLKAPFSAAGEVVTSIYHCTTIPFTATSHGLSQGALYVRNTGYGLWNLICSVVITIWSALCGGVAAVVTAGGGLVTSLRAMSFPTFESSKVSTATYDPSVSSQQPLVSSMQQTQQASSIPNGPSVEEIVLKVLSDVRFAAMIEENVKTNVEKSGDKQRKENVEREKELQDKVTELCTRLVESEIIKYKATVTEQKEQDLGQLQSTTPATVTVTDGEDLEKYKTQIEDLIHSIKLLETETQTSFVDLMAKFSGVIDNKIKAAFAVYDADKTGLTDYALESAGGAVVNIRCTETYTVKDPYYVLFGYSLWRRDSSPRKAIQPGLLPGDCWPFQGAVGCLVLKLSHRIKITKFSMEHIPRALTPSGEIDSAPNKFTVWGLRENYDEQPTFLGEFAYDQDGPTLQYFDALDTPDTFEMVELKILSNHGNIEYTCLYRFRVHGSLAPPSTNHNSAYQGHMAANHNTYRQHVSPSHTKYNPV